MDEAHHASADTYQKVLSYFTPEFTLGLTATPERADDKNILDIFKNTAHKLDIQTAVEIGELVPVRCIRIHTNIDLTKVRFNSVQYNIRDLESKIYVPERNQLIVDHLAPVCEGQANGHLLRLRQARPGDRRRSMTLVWPPRPCPERSMPVTAGRC